MGDATKGGFEIDVRNDDCVGMWLMVGECVGDQCGRVAGKRERL